MGHQAMTDSPTREFRSRGNAWTSDLGHFRPINDVCAMSAFHPIATKLLHYGK